MDGFLEAATLGFDLAQTGVAVGECRLSGVWWDLATVLASRRIALKNLLISVSGITLFVAIPSYFL